MTNPGTAAVSFQLRFAMISALQKAWLERVQEKKDEEKENTGVDGQHAGDLTTIRADPRQAYEWAKATEERTFNCAADEHEYRKKCEDAVQALGKRSPTKQRDLLAKTWDGLASSTSTKKMGRYAKLVPHSRGRFSTLYKALRIPDEVVGGDEKSIRNGEHHNNTNNHQSDLDLDHEPEESPDWFQPKSKSVATELELEATTKATKGFSPPDHLVYALKVTMPGLMCPPHDSRREVRILRHLARFCEAEEESGGAGDQGLGKNRIVMLLDTFRHDGDFFVIVFPFLPLNLQDLLDNVKARQLRRMARQGARTTAHPERGSRAGTPTSPSESAPSQTAASLLYTSFLHPLSQTAEIGDNDLLALGGNLGPVLSESQLRSTMRDIFTALSHIHAAGVIHRDIKPANILLRSLDGPAYVTDFGISWVDPAVVALTQSDTTNNPANKTTFSTSTALLSSEPPAQKIIDIGTEQFRAPELLFGYKAYGPEVDLWAAGCLVAEAMDSQGRELFFAGDLGSDLVLIHSIFTSLGTPNERVWPEILTLPDWGKLGFIEYPAKPWTELLPDVSDTCRDFVSRLVTYSQRERMSAQKALDHPFLALAGEDAQVKKTEPI